MNSGIVRSVLALGFLLGLGLTAHAEDQATAQAPNAARDLTTSKCFQCHSQAMWQNQRLDARGWEATLYRMVARGAAWSTEEVQDMSRYLASDYGPGVPRTFGAKPQ